MKLLALIISIVFVASVATLSLVPVKAESLSPPPRQRRLPLKQTRSGPSISKIDFETKLIAPAFHTSKDAKEEIVDRLKQMTQELLDAIAPGDKAVWQRYLAEGSIYADEEGRVLTKDELLKELNPLPAGYVGTIKIGEMKVLAKENTVVISHRDREELELYNQKIVTYFHMTNTWAKQSDGQWLLVATQVMAIPNERKPAVIDPKSLDAYIGHYELAPQVAYVITREGDKLFGQRTGRAKEELLPLCNDTFYRKGVWRGEKVFERDAKSKVVRMLDRRENNDLVWKRVK